MILEFENGNLLMPKFAYSESLKDELIQPWKEALIAKPLGQNVDLAAFDKRVREIWKPRGEMEIIILGFGYYLIKYDNEEIRKGCFCKALG